MLSFHIFEQWIPLFESLHNHKLSEKALIMFYESIKSFSDDNFDDLCKEIYQKEEFMPKPATFHRYQRQRLETELEAWWPAILSCASSGSSIDHFPTSLRFALNSFAWMKACRMVGEQSIKPLKAKIVGLMADYDPDQHSRLLPQSEILEQPVPTKFNEEGLKALIDFSKTIPTSGKAMPKKSFDSVEPSTMSSLNGLIDQFVDEKLGF